MQAEKYNDAKKEIRSVLLTYQSSITLEEFLRAYKNLLGVRLPSKALGFPSDVKFLQSMPDVVNVCTDPHGKVLLSGIADKTSEHIQKLVSKQRKPQKKNSKSNKNFSKQRISNTDLKEEAYLPATLRAEILKLMEMFPDGVTFIAFAIAYHRKFNKYLPLIRGLDSLESMINLIPELEIRTINNDKIICYADGYIDNIHQDACLANKSVSTSQKAKDEEYKTFKASKIQKSGIADDILHNFQLLLQKCPEGIVDMHFPLLYEHLTKRHFDVLELGYSSILELVDDLPHIFKRVLNEDKNWVILPAKMTVEKHFAKDGSLVLPNSQSKTFSKIQKGMPADAASPALQYIQPVLPQNLDLSEYVPVFVSAVINPSRFWFQLKTENAIKEFEKFEKDLGYFYDYQANSNYVMNDADIDIGATCVVCYPKDRHWYRAVIKAIPCPKFINVSFVDYGKRENVLRANLHYVRSKYLEYPVYAFEAHLAGLKPPKNASKWNVEAQQRFIQLCECPSLMAYLNPISKNTFSAFLCDTSGDSDVHLNYTLIKEGLAEICLENNVGVVDNLSEESNESLINGNASESENYFSSESFEQDADRTQPSQIKSVPESESNGVKRKFIFSSNEQADGNEPTASCDEKGQKSKRFVKKVELCEPYIFHVINLEDELFMTCGDLSRLLWEEKDSAYLIERLKYKEVDVPFLRLKKEYNIPLFKQCIWYKISEYEKLLSNDSSLVIYPLKCAFNILNIFGHPSVCLRLAIQDEIKSFDPSDPIWKEFKYDESQNLSDFEKELEIQLSELCLYDLKAKNEALKVKRIRLLQMQNSSATEEIRKIDYFQNAIQRRMQHIEKICSLFSI